MKAYKGFNPDMTCRGFQYEEGKTYETYKAKLCSVGFHACEAPLEVMQYYRPSKARYHEVDLDDVSDERDGGSSKIVGKKITIGAETGIPGLVKAHIEWTRERAQKEGAATSGYRSSAATSGDWSSAATSGYWSSAATSGDWSSAATSGDWSSAATSGDRSSAATSGDRSSAATSGDWSSAATSGYRSSAATSGDWSSAATSGYGSSAATSGDWSSAATSGYRSSAATSGNGSSAATSGEESSAATNHPNGIALACGKNSKAKGVVGAYIILTEWDEDATTLISARMARVDGETIKADTWYTLRGGDFVEVPDEDDN